MENVCAVVVTYNRCQLLKECLESLLNQSYSLSKIYVVNNNSTDQTKEMLDDLSQKEPAIVPIHLDENIGGAGGFYTGVKEALESQCDWIWIMDDDAEPDHKCLEKLIQSVKDINEEVGFVAPVIINKHTNNIQNYHHKKVNKTLTRDRAIDLETINNNKYIEVNANAFVGPLISTKAVKKVGLPRKDFFIWLDDTEYTYRISRVMKSYLISDAVIYHKDSPTNGIDPKSFWKVCYGFRNRILWVNSSLKGLNKIASYTSLMGQYIKLLISILLRYKWKNNRYVCMKYLTLALLKGIKNTGGIFVTPQEYLCQIK